MFTNILPTESIESLSEKKTEFLKSINNTKAEIREILDHIKWMESEIVRLDQEIYALTPPEDLLAPVEEYEPEEITSDFCTSCGGIVNFYKGHAHCIECENHAEPNEPDHTLGVEY